MCRTRSSSAPPATGRSSTRCSRPRPRPDVPGAADLARSTVRGVWVCDAPTGTIAPQCYHLWPALLATSYDAGGRAALLVTVPLMGVLSVLVLCALLRRVGDELLGPTEAAVAAMAGQVAGLGEATFVSENDRRVRERGDVAWFAEHGAMRFGERGLRVRLTGVAVRRDGGWKLAQLQAAPCCAPVELTARGS